eukprot:TRINITY_DN72232_c0_g1_i1.p1 TRINITY_DN72232_c0_g1~~TRINITY_DN72232_c0_g1_i1.p1  ORF type:complete len:658 (+),score=76.14 TRINITY_DN72232_c0_g1_i1:46-1974(+)
MGIAESACRCFDDRGDACSASTIMAHVPPSRAGTSGRKWRPLHAYEGLVNRLQFPMYVVPMEHFQQMTQAKPHQVLLAEGKLQEFSPNAGNCIFVSHEWMGFSSPDPLFEQLAVLKGAICNLLEGRAQVALDILYLLEAETIQVDRAEELNSAPLFLWYDYFCSPQPDAQTADPNQSEDFRRAAESIPAYVELSRFFFILAPHSRHSDLPVDLSYHTWKKRGWCRAERVARAISSRASHMTIVRSATDLQHATAVDSYCSPVGQGHFTVEADRKRVAFALQTMVRAKLMSTLDVDSFHEFRILSCMQTVILKGLPADPVLDILDNADSAPASASQSVAKDEEHSWGSVHNFLSQNGFVGVSECTDVGWTPVCYAALTGQPALIKSLLELRANADIKIKNEPALGFSEGSHVTDLCAVLGHHEAMDLFLSEMTNDEDVLRTALLNCTFTDNWLGIEVLLNHGVNAQTLHVNNIVSLAIARSSGKVLQGLLEKKLVSTSEAAAAANRACVLGGSNFCAACYLSATPETVWLFVGLKADINSQVWKDRSSALEGQAKRFEDGLAIDCNSRFIYHAYGATPLIASVSAGNYDVAEALLDAGADANIRNWHGFTAADIARGLNVPPRLLSRLGPSAAAVKPFKQDAS